MERRFFRPDQILCFCFSQIIFRCKKKQTTQKNCTLQWSWNASLHQKGGNKLWIIQPQNMWTANKYKHTGRHNTHMHAHTHAHTHWHRSALFPGIFINVVFFLEKTIIIPVKVYKSFMSLSILKCLALQILWLF